ncbi:unnamed protein product [Pleuronectes platessa]|uniref:G-protein coupled receptors family 1 profile domain-containing protein n=1 Tax=Pleuronectes platessa TaxID=8262 RepID=A0A9N7VE96_PLEPL|nr:unnamed protein product [Pleuronectes platessa]
MGYHWPFGVALCKISSYVVLLNMYASVFCLTCMSFDRYLAIVHSLSSTQLRSRGHTRGCLIGIWLLSGLLAAPTLVFRTTKDDPSSNRTSCAMDFSLVLTAKKEENLWIAGLSISSSALGFLLPFLAMMVCYGFIGCTVTRHFNTLRKEDQRKRRLLKIITTLVVVFAACWTPFHLVKSADALSYLDLFPATCAFLRFLLLAHPYATCLAYINSCLNPFLYAFFDLRFRSQCLCLLNLKKSLHASPASSLSSQKTEAQSLATKVVQGVILRPPLCGLQGLDELETLCASRHSVNKETKKKKTDIVSGDTSFPKAKKKSGCAPALGDSGSWFMPKWAPCPLQQDRASSEAQLH